MAKRSHNTDIIATSTHTTNSQCHLRPPSPPTVTHVCNAKNCCSSLSSYSSFLCFHFYGWWQPVLGPHNVLFSWAPVSLFSCSQWGQNSMWPLEDKHCTHGPFFCAAAPKAPGWKSVKVSKKALVSSLSPFFRKPIIFYKERDLSPITLVTSGGEASSGLS